MSCHRQANFFVSYYGLAYSTYRFDPALLREQRHYRVLDQLRLQIYRRTPRSGPERGVTRESARAVAEQREEHYAPKATAENRRLVHIKGRGEATLIVQLYQDTTRCCSAVLTKSRVNRLGRHATDAKNINKSVIQSITTTLKKNTKNIHAALIF